MDFMEDQVLRWVICVRCCVGHECGVSLYVMCYLCYRCCVVCERSVLWVLLQVLCVVFLRGVICWRCYGSRALAVLQMWCCLYYRCRVLPVYMSYARGAIGMCWLDYRCHVLAVLQVSCVTYITDVMCWLYCRCHALPVYRCHVLPVLQVSCVGCITGVVCCRCHVGHGMGQRSLSLEG